MATHSCTFAWRIPWMTLVGCSPWGREESDTTEHLHFHFSLSCIGEGSGGPLQCSCLENPRDGGAWWAAVYGVAQSRTRLKRLSSSSSSSSSSSIISYHLLVFVFKVALAVAQTVKNPPAILETQFWSLGWEDSWEMEMATHCSILA